jgi:hypothetical protein
MTARRSQIMKKLLVTMAVFSLVARVSQTPYTEATYGAATVDGAVVAPPSTTPPKFAVG